MKKYSFIIISIVLVYMFLIIIWAKDMSIYVLNSVKSCVNVIIPSMYIFMIVSDFLITSNIYALLGKPFSLLSRYVLKMPEELFSVFLISSISGYPVGAKLLADLWDAKKIDKKTAEDMLPYCYLSGPAFICGMVGINVFYDYSIGILIFVSILLSNLITAIVIGRKRDIPPVNTYAAEYKINANLFIKSISNGGKSMFSICTVIIFFSSLICILEKSGLTSFAATLIDEYTVLDFSAAVTLIKSIVEISNVSSFQADITLVPLITALLSFGGLCVIIQIRSILSSNLSIRNFLIFRVTSMLLSYFICKFLLMLLINKDIFTYSPAQVSNSQNSPISTLFLLIMTILFLLKFSIEKIKKT